MLCTQNIRQHLQAKTARLNPINSYSVKLLPGNGHPIEQSQNERRIESEISEAFAR